MPTPNGVNDLLQFLIDFFQFPNCPKQESKVDVLSYVLMSVMLPYAVVILLLLCLWKPHNAKSACKYNQFYRLQGKDRQKCAKEGAIFFSACRKVEFFCNSHILCFLFALRLKPLPDERKRSNLQFARFRKTRLKSGRYSFMSFYTFICPLAYLF